ncbi:hypothetical protein [Thermus scotoductus]|uniref:Uncharacterized protein n=1 Tax=Thermus scotoductus TaxID=37636 RepID=A0A430R1K5_THESC|nr:hypothetical protein [Thermus scotoductus]RTG93387.1 hypothetical protein CSW49_10870 [Thermus scotoductus]RTH01272.1 hypothetical protein CSW45_10755 [Thermus scotoductus]RTH17158.1 hypothetical protein CSW42_11030 [Thermus scotoductus]RTH97404.1 hypothetical protein CSW28_10895 [Thermus scotoductus]RTI18651.1 hypothetical protein CSW21_10595 [Thermus scotoductus]
MDASTGIVLVLRGLGLPTKLSEELLKEVKRLEESPWPGEAAYHRHINGIYARFSSEELARHAEIYRVP